MDGEPERAHACRYRGNTVPSVQIHYQHKEDAGGPGAQKDEAYLHISVLLDPALFHPVPLCRLALLLSPWQHFSAIYLHGEAARSSCRRGSSPGLSSLPLNQKGKKKRKKNREIARSTHTHTLPDPRAYRRAPLCCLLKSRRGRLICAALSPSLFLSLCSIHITEKPSPSFSDSFPFSLPPTLLLVGETDRPQRQRGGPTPTCKEGHFKHLQKHMLNRLKQQHKMTKSNVVGCWMLTQYVEITTSAHLLPFVENFLKNAMQSPKTIWE